jgi:hypothetical protein
MKNTLKPLMLPILIASCGLVLAVTSYAVFAQSAYKWVDAKGQTHYGDQLPNNQVVGATVKLQSAVNGVVANPTNQPNTAGSEKKLPRELQSSVNDAAISLSKMRTETADLSCSKAVDNARSGVETMLEVAQKNFNGGYMAKSEYEEGTKGLRDILSRLSVGECQASTGPVRSFYQCMSSERSHVAACGQKYSYQ